MKLSKAGEDLMHKYEGFRSRPYLCPAHIWTIGYGHVLYQEQIRLPVVRVEGKDTPMIRKEMPLKQEDNRVWTKTEIDELFRADVGTFERGVLRLVPDWVGAAEAFRVWTKGGGKVLPGLVKRREAEIALFLS